MTKGTRRRLLWRPRLSPEQFDRLEQALDPDLAGVHAAREVLVEGEGIAIAAERHRTPRQTLRTRLLGILEQGADREEVIGLRVHCLGHDPEAFASELGVDPEAIDWRAPSALSNAVSLMRLCAEETHTAWPDLRTMLALLPGSERYESALAAFFREEPTAIHARRQAQLSDYGARSGLVDIVIDLPAREYRRLPEIAEKTPLAVKCPRKIERNALWEIASRLPYARSRATRRELFDLLRDPGRGGRGKGAIGITERIFAEIGVGAIRSATPGLVRAPEGVAPLSRMLIHQHGALVNREASIRAVYDRDVLARVLRACRRQLAPRLRSKAGRTALKSVYLEGESPASAFPKAGLGSVPSRDLIHVRRGLKHEPAHVFLHYLADQAQKPALDAELIRVGATLLTVASPAAEQAPGSSMPA